MSWKFDIHEGELWIASKHLVGVIGRKALWNSIQRSNTGQSPFWRVRENTSDGRLRWIAIPSIGQKLLEDIERRFGPIWYQVLKELLPPQVERMIQPFDMEYFLERKLSTEQARHLARACGWCRRLSVRKWWHDWRGIEPPLKGVDAWKHAARIITEEALYNFRPGSGRWLRARVRQFMKDERAALVPRKKGNKNAAKGGRLRQKAIARMIDLYAAPIKMSVDEVASVYNHEARERGWPLFSAERIRQILYQPEHKVQWVASRHGVNAARGLVEPSLRRRRPAHPDALWSIDGTTLQLYAQNGKRVKPWYVVLVTDAYSDAIIGYGLGTTETADVILRALRMAAERSGYAPRVVQYDGATANLGHEVQQVLNAMGSLGIQAQPYNGKSKYVERVIGRLEQGVLRHYPNFVGGNITGRSLDARANPDLIASIELPSPGEVVRQFEQAVEVYNNKPGKKGTSPAQRYDAPRPDDLPKLEYLTLVSIFWVERRQPLRYGKDGIVMEVNGERHYYHVVSEPMVEDVEFRKAHLGDRFWVRYNPDDLREINLYDYDTREWIATAVQQHEFGALPHEWEEGEGTALRKNLENRRALVEDSIEAAERIRRLMSEEDLEEASFELLHKDELNGIQSAFEEQLIEQQAHPRRPLYYNPDVARRLLEDEEDFFE